MKKLDEIDEIHHLEIILHTDDDDEDDALVIIDEVDDEVGAALDMLVNDELGVMCLAGIDELEYIDNDTDELELDDDEDELDEFEDHGAVAQHQIVDGDESL